MPTLFPKSKKSKNPRAAFYSKREQGVLAVNMVPEVYEITTFVCILALFQFTFMLFGRKTHPQLSRKNSVGTGGRHLLCLIFSSCWKQQLDWCSSCAGRVQRAWPNCEYEEEQTAQDISSILGPCGISNGRYRHQCELSWSRLGPKDRPWRWGTHLFLTSAEIHLGRILQQLNWNGNLPWILKTNMHNPRQNHLHSLQNTGKANRIFFQTIVPRRPSLMAVCLIVMSASFIPSNKLPIII